MYYKNVYVKLFTTEITIAVPCTPEISEQELSNKAHKMLKDAVKGARFSVDRMAN